MAATFALCVAAQAAEINGAGATFPYPIYAKWAEAYAAKTGLKMNYQSIGSGGGIKQITAKTVDFGASDMPLKPADLEKDGLIQFPMVMGGVVPVVNLPGIKPGQLKLTARCSRDIYLGKITKWNDPAIAALNPGVKLPDTAIARGPPLRRLGHDLHLHPLPVEGEPGVEGEGRREHRRSNGRPGSAARAMKASSAMCSRTAGAIGYVEYAYAKQNKMTYTCCKNQDGNSCSPRSRPSRRQRPMPTGTRRRISTCC